MKGQNAIKAKETSKAKWKKKEKEKDCQIGEENKDIWRIL